MFISLNCTNGPLITNGIEYILEDSEFTVIFIIPYDTGVGIQYYCSVLLAIIKEYEKRHLNVVTNSIIGWKYYGSKYNLSYMEICEQGLQYHPVEFKKFLDKYSENIKKYLLLL